MYDRHTRLLHPPIHHRPVWVSYRHSQMYDRHTRLLHAPIHHRPVWVSYRHSQMYDRHTRLLHAPIHHRPVWVSYRHSLMYDRHTGLPVLETKGLFNELLLLYTRGVHGQAAGCTLYEPVRQDGAQNKTLISNTGLLHTLYITGQFG